MLIDLLESSKAIGLCPIGIHIHANARWHTYTHKQKERRGYSAHGEKDMH